MSTKNPLEANFINAYQRLNQKQKEAVDAIEGPVMVIAGPGTGKTQILTLRIANILRQTDTKPENILALTFTDAGVAAMQKRLQYFIGKEAYRVAIHTFHSFAGEVIRRYPENYERIVGGRPASDLEKNLLIEDILNQGKFKSLRPLHNPTLNVKSILGAIADLKKDSISPEVFAEFVDAQERELATMEQFHTKAAHKGKVKGDYEKARKALQKNQELLLIFRLYNQLMQENRWFDFEDMILETIKALSDNPEMLLDLQEQYQYLLADEHQDVNHSQNQIIELLANFHQNPNVFVVGDEKQAIYRFQGASLQNFLYFETHFGDTTTIALTENYRSKQEILDVAHSSIKSDDERLNKYRVPLLAKGQIAGETVLEQRIFSHQAIEDAWLVDRVKQYQTAGVSWSEIAIFLKTNQEVEEVTALLRKAGVPVNPSVDRDVLLHPIFQNLKRLVRFIIEPTNTVATAEGLFLPCWQIPVADLARIMTAQTFSKNLNQIIASQEELQLCGVEAVKSVLRVVEVREKIRERALVETPAVLLEVILAESGFLASVMKMSPLEGGAIVRRIYDEVEKMFANQEVNNLAGVLRVFDLYETYGLAFSAPLIKQAEGVFVSTAHKSKGLEFEVVLIPRLTSTRWEAKRARSSTFQLPTTAVSKEDKELFNYDDNLKLFYVVSTRAKRVLEYSYAEMTVEGKGQKPSEFLVNLDQTDLKTVDTAGFADNFSETDGLVPLPPIKLDSSFLRQRLADNGWSASALNLYLKSPWDFIFEKVLHFPSVKTPALYLGQVVHRLLETAAYRLKRQEVVDVNWAIKNLDRELSGLPITPEDFTRFHERGLEMVTGYTEHLAGALGTFVETEHALQAVLPTGILDFPEITLHGSVDRLDLDEDGTVWRVVDYKTGKPKTRNELAGLTKNSTGDYKRQLTFYALLLELQTEKKWHCRRCLVSFVELDEKGKRHEEEFIITDEEIEILKQEIILVTKEVLTGECLTAEVGEESKYQALVEGWR